MHELQDLGNHFSLLAALKIAFCKARPRIGSPVVVQTLCRAQTGKSDSDGKLAIAPNRQLERLGDISTR